MDKLQLETRGATLSWVLGMAPCLKCDTLLAWIGSRTEVKLRQQVTDSQDEFGSTDQSVLTLKAAVRLPSNLGPTSLLTWRNRIVAHFSNPNLDIVGLLRFRKCLPICEPSLGDERLCDSFATIFNCPMVLTNVVTSYSDHSATLNTDIQSHLFAEGGAESHPVVLQVLNIGQERKSCYQTKAADSDNHLGPLKAVATGEKKRVETMIKAVQEEYKAKLLSASNQLIDAETPKKLEKKFELEEEEENVVRRASKRFKFSTPRPKSPTI